MTIIQSQLYIICRVLYTPFFLLTGSDSISPSLRSLPVAHFRSQGFSHIFLVSAALPVGLPACLGVYCLGYGFTTPLLDVVLKYLASLFCNKQP